MVELGHGVAARGDGLGLEQRLGRRPDRQLGGQDAGKVDWAKKVLDRAKDTWPKRAKAFAVKTAPASG